MLFLADFSEYMLNEYLINLKYPSVRCNFVVTKVDCIG